MYVIKRDGTKEILNLEKIRKQTIPATEGLENVSYEELELDAKINFYDGIKTTEIQQSLIKTALDKIDVDRPQWTYVAARLFLNDLYHKVGKKLKNKKGNPYPHLKTYIQYGQKIGRFNIGFEKKYDLEELNKYIKPERDLQFTYHGIKNLYDRYIIKDIDGEPIELPQLLFMAVAMFLAQNEKEPMEWAKKFYDVISKFEVMVATPTLSNARTTRHQLSSCYVGSTPDNIEGIFDGYKDMALLSKYGGGIGWDYTNVRGAGSEIDKHKRAAGGIIPFLKINNDVAIAVDQLGTRPGAIAVYLEPWHIDVEDFIDLKKTSGEERRRAHDLFPALWINDLFMKRAENDEDWTLFDPYEVKDLPSLYGKEFEKKYIEYEKNPNIRKEKVSAKKLWKKILLSYFETGTPFLGFKDTANLRNQGNGIIRSSNLCTEIFQSTEPAQYVVKIEFENGDIEYFNEEDIIKTDTGVAKPAKKITTIDSINGKKVFFTSKVKKDGTQRVAVCNLASINLSKVNTKEQLERIIPITVRMLDNVIDLNFYPIKETKETNSKTRAIGLGVMGEGEFIANKQIMYGTPEHLELIDELYEIISYNAIKASIDLAKEKGKYPNFENSKWAKGQLPIDTMNPNAKEIIKREFTYNWEKLRTELVKNGIRNEYLMAIAPTGTISLITGTTPSHEPVYKKKWFEENLSGLIPVTAPNINIDNYQYYISSMEIDQLLIVTTTAIRQKWIDQGISMNIYINPNDTRRVSGKYLNQIYMTAWKLGLKSCYYLRTLSIEDETTDVQDRSIECSGCQ